MTTAVAGITMPGVLRGALTSSLRVGHVRIAALDLLGTCALVVLAVLLAMPGAQEPGVSVTAVQRLGLFAVAFAILLRQSRPLAAAAVVTGACAVVQTAGPGIVDCSEIVPALALVAYAAGAQTDRRAAVLGLGIALCGLTIELARDPVLGVSGLPLFAPLLSIVWFCGRGAAALRARARELEVRGAELIAQQQRTAALAVTVERDRIGSELQAAITDGLQAMLGATAAARADEQSVAQALDTVQARGRLLLDEMRGVLGVLRRDDTIPDRAPQPSLRDLDRLMVDARVRGVPITVHHEGMRRPLATAPDRCAYRIIERVVESAPTEPVAVCVRWLERDVELEVDAAEDVAWPAMVAAARERTAVCEGQLIVATPDAGRVGLRARLPLAGVRA